MNKFAVVSISVSVAALVVVAFASQKILRYYDQEFLTIRAGKIQLDAANPSRIKGSFSIDNPTNSVAAPGVIRSQGTGGACLVADLNFMNIPSGIQSECTANSKCNDLLQLQFPNQKWQGYCIDGTCWTRPGSQPSYCLISATHNSGNPWAKGSHSFPTSSIDTSANSALSIQPGKRVVWRVHACLNAYDLYAEADSTTACKDGIGERLTHDGQVMAVP